MNFHPDVLAAHAQFGGDLESMQALYDRPDHVAEIARLQEQVEALRKERDQANDLIDGWANSFVAERDLREAAEAERDRLREALTQISLAPMFVTTDRDKWIDWAVETAEAALQKEPQPPTQERDDGR